jgi:hypothetical protein
LVKARCEETAALEGVLEAGVLVPAPVPVPVPVPVEEELTTVKGFDEVTGSELAVEVSALVLVPVTDTAVVGVPELEIVAPIVNTGDVA